MTPVRLGAVGYLNARPHVFGLERAARFTLRFDVPSKCAALLHDDEVDLGLIPSIEYLRGRYAIVPDVAIASRGPVASVVLYTTRPIADVRSIALDTSSRTSVALTRVLCTRAFRIQPAFEPHGADLGSMLARNDAALIIGDYALFSDEGAGAARARETTALRRPSVPAGGSPAGARAHAAGGGAVIVEKIDLGDVWTSLTGLPFVYAFWAGRPERLTPDDVGTLQQARDAGVRNIDEIAAQYSPGSPARQDAGARYLRDNIKYHLGPDECAGLELFYRYAVEANVVPEARPLRFY